MRADIEDWRQFLRDVASIISAAMLWYTRLAKTTTYCQKPRQVVTVDIAGIVMVKLSPDFLEGSCAARLNKQPTISFTSRLYALICSRVRDTPSEAS
jgi:hypothetical protein